MTYAWYCRKDFVGHSGLVISFDDTPNLCFDFGTSTSEVLNKIKIAVAAKVVSYSHFSDYCRRIKKHCSTNEIEKSGKFKLIL